MQQVQLVGCICTMSVVISCIVLVVFAISATCNILSSQAWGDHVLELFGSL